MSYINKYYLTIYSMSTIYAHISTIIILQQFIKKKRAGSLFSAVNNIILPGLHGHGLMSDAQGLSRSVEAFELL